MPWRAKSDLSRQVGRGFCFKLIDFITFFLLSKLSLQRDIFIVIIAEMSCGDIENSNITLKYIFRNNY